MVYRNAIVLALAGMFIGPYAPVPHQATLAFRTPSADSVMTEPNAGSRPLVRLLDAAQTTIFVEIYILTYQPIVRALERASAHGVDVRVMLDPAALGMGTQPVREAMLLRAGGIDVRWSSPAFPLTHAKLMVADDRVAVVSTANFSRSAFTGNREFLVVDRRPAEVRALSDLFRHDWDRLPAARSAGRLVLSPTNARASIDGLIARTRRSLDVYAEELRDPQVERVLVVARLRGVHVRILLPPGIETSGERELRRAGVLLCQPQVPYIHAKVMIADHQIAYVGSTNISSQSLDRNREVGLIETGHVVAVFERVFAKDWCHSAIRGRRGILHRFRRASRRGVDFVHR